MRSVETTALEGLERPASHPRTDGSGQRFARALRHPTATETTPRTVVPSLAQAYQTIPIGQGGLGAVGEPLSDVPAAPIQAAGDRGFGHAEMARGLRVGEPLHVDGDDRVAK